MSRSRHRRASSTVQIVAVLGLSAGLSVLVAPCSARAGDNDASSFYDMTFGRVLEGFGFKRSDREGQIEYRERPPLVLPNSHELPPPEKAEAFANPNWPKDPDVKRRKLIEQQEKNRNVSDEREREQNPLRPEELAPGPRPRDGTISAGRGRSGASDFGEILSPSALGYKGGLLSRMFHGKDEDSAQFTGEPPRTELTDPPPGYQTPSPDQPYGIGGGYKPKVESDYLHRGELKR
jgi:hypothetical protein